MDFTQFNEFFSQAPAIFILGFFIQYFMRKESERIEYEKERDQQFTRVIEENNKVKRALALAILKIGTNTSIEPEAAQFLEDIIQGKKPNE